MNKSYDEMSEEELKVFAEKFRKEQEEQYKSNLRCEEIKQMFQKGNLTKLDIHWHLDKNDINFKLQKEQLDSELLTDGYTIIESVDIEKVLDSMQSGNPEFYREKHLFHEDWCDGKICGVIDFWLKKQKLIPPSIIWNHMLDRTYVADGKHRFNVAYFFGEKYIPIIIPNKHYEQVYRLIFN